MKIEIDLDELLHDADTGYTESLRESIRRQVVETITARTRDDVKRQISDTVSEVLNEELAKAVREQMPALVAGLMDATYQPVDRYGKLAPTTTFRAELLKTITEQAVYRKVNYDSDKNAFTRAVDEAVKGKLAEFQAAWTKQVDGAFVQQALAHATEALRKRLGIVV